MATSRTTDRAVGLPLLFGLLSLGGALVTLFASSQLTSAWGFAAAVAAACLAVTALHVYGPGVGSGA